MERKEPTINPLKRKKNLHPIFGVRKKTKLRKQDQYLFHEKPEVLGGPLDRLQEMLPRLEKLLLHNESPSDRTTRVNREFLIRYPDYLNDFKAFVHQNDPVLFNRGTDGLLQNVSLLCDFSYNLQKRRYFLR